MMKTSLPDAAELIEAARQAMATVPMDPFDRENAAARRREAASDALNKWAPAIDRIATITDAAAFLGVSDDTVRRRRFRARADGTPEWPQPDRQIGPTKGWTYRTIVLHQAEAPRRGRHGSALAPIPGDVVAYLAVADIADHFGVAANTVHQWRTRYRPGRSLEETARYPVTPQPDVVIGLKHPQAGWKQDRLKEWDDWLSSLPDHGGKGGRPRTNAPGKRAG